MSLDWAMVFSFSINKKMIFKKLVCLLLPFFFFSFGMTGCTSSDEDDISVLEDGLENIDGEIDSDISDDENEDAGDEDKDWELATDEEDDEEIEDDEDTELAQLDEEFADSEDEDDEDGEFADLDEEDGDDEDDEFADLDEEDGDDEDDEFADLDDDDEDDEDDEFADLDEEDGDDEDDEFADLDDDEDDGEDGELAQNEESLGEELTPGEEQSEFPEEVVEKEGAESGTPGTGQTEDITIGQTEETPLPQDDLGEADPITDEKEETPRWIPVVKIKTDTEYRGGRLINAVYIVRPQDSMESISDKIYGGTDKVGELNTNNPHLAKGIDPGDKVYYNSPNRPEDKSQIKFFYEDMGLEPQVYVTKENDNMRRLGSRLLGFADGWKEIWAINQDVDSKTILPGGLRLKYWTGSESTLNVAEVTPEMENESDMGDDTEMPEPEEIAATGTMGEPPAEPNLPEPPLPEPQMNMPENDLEPSEIADVEAFPEPEAEPPTPDTEVVSATEPESLVSVGALALIFLAALMLVVIQIKKRSSTTALNPSSLEYTQV